MAASPTFIWLNPPGPNAMDEGESPRYAVGDTIVPRWYTTWMDTKLGIYQGDLDLQAPQLHMFPFNWESPPECGNASWEVDLSSSTADPPYDFSLSDNGAGFTFIASRAGYTGEETEWVTSHTFNIVDEAVSGAVASGSITSSSLVITSTATSTSAAPSTSTAPTAAAPSVSHTTGTPPHQPTSSVDPSPSGLSNSAKIGIGAGLGVGLTCLLVAGAAASWWIRRRRAQGVSLKPEASEETEYVGLERSE